MNEENFLIQKTNYNQNTLASTPPPPQHNWLPVSSSIEFKISTLTF